MSHTNGRNGVNLQQVQLAAMADAQQREMAAVTAMRQQDQARAVLLAVHAGACTLMGQWLRNTDNIEDNDESLATYAATAARASYACLQASENALNQMAERNRQAAQQPKVAPKEAPKVSLE